ncbi:aspartyl-phosphate phosphatase Spo0E family protein [Cellulosilyticum ruminicola]|uniref:aspartyl-phosphate phosphatase Spo0E family protein n=1 Tax=Cellulosilyticum ruminicola TaxID=425254 RepID=UPI0009F83BF7|nr:aspartyl-phosphate phosphatase Spo0E family protein [Cellulosilyticum ruminicola]
MNNRKKRISTMQEALNRLLMTSGANVCRSKTVYKLSMQLDKEIVKYYRSIENI